MTAKVAELLAKLNPDPWRAATDFGPELADANRRMFAAGEDRDAIRSALSSWLQKHQPCVFGKLAARFDLVSYCILTEGDLRKGDVAIRNQIKAARQEWTRQGFSGSKSGFVILAVSPALATATPDQTLLELAQRLGFLYLQHELAVDKVYHDAIWLQKPGVEGMTWQWLAGVNYFCANADGRWWQDHRIPGGLAFSVNSVGHLAKAGAIANAMNALDQVLGVPNESATPTKVDSLGKALEFAMRTIDKASRAVSGKAMQLMPLPQGALPSPKCPVQLPADLADKDFRCYRGYYHTDITLPSEYFLPDIQRPSHCKPQTLDFSYLFDDDLENPDYWTMGAGRRTRGDSPKRSRFEPMSLLIADCERLVQVLNGKP